MLTRRWSLTTRLRALGAIGDGARVQADAGRRDSDGQRAQSVEPGRETLDETVRHVLHDDDGRREVAG